MAREKDNYSPKACLETFVLPNSGHDMNLHPNAPDWFKVANEWVARRVGATVKAAPTELCQTVS